MNKNLIILSVALSASSAQAAIVSLYDFTAVTDPNDSTETFLSASVDTNPDSTSTSVTSPATNNGGTVHPEFGDVFSNGGNQAIGWSARGNNPSQTFTIVNPIDTFVSFSVTLNTAYNLDSLTVDTGAFSSIGGNTGYDYTLSFSTNGSAFNTISTITSGTGANQAARQTGNGTNVAAINFDLSGTAALQGYSGQVFFRLDPVASAGTAQNGVQSQRAGFIDNLALNGTAVPEPSSTALLGLSGLALLLRRKK